ncbi:hypothetical protein COT52_01780 [candidate division WWE3 bacterium CG08_land_8_20_14_0_20_43_13]|uniref:DUF4349 domain-containing protein n=1 Tax=candidate division WWE3 bacterium CG08_land_8_20_14_0_20_43_13 TaxID=1975087 RepID=A0A2H0X7B0_UNCKA|nr:MAG: hypothetical protein COT52_01780 [candidate division WWE3 bacterium CG08_land_8_20_14_0_20_43_13]
MIPTTCINFFYPLCCAYMINKIISWIKSNKFATMLILVVAYLLFRSSRYNPLLLSSSYNTNYLEGALSDISSRNIGVMAPVSSGVSRESPPAPEATDRLVVKNSNLSLQVKDVADSMNKIQATAEGFGGYLVSSSLSRPLESSTGNITVRVPVTSLDQALSAYRSLAVKVVSENLYGHDVTDQYVDLDARLATYYKTKEKFEQILDRAVTVEDSLNVTRELINLQSNIDNLLGQKLYLEKTAQNSLITVYLSTDEYALPWTPDQPWRPVVIFKQAVRSLVVTFRSLGTKVIWLAVYSIIWVPVLLIVRFVWRRLSRPQTKV